MKRMIATILNSIGFQFSVPDLPSQVIEKMREELTVAVEQNKRAGEEAVQSVTQFIVRATGK